MNPEILYHARAKSALVAALLTLVFPGLAYLYCGMPWRFVASALLVLTFGLLTLGYGLLLIYPLFLIDSVFLVGRYNRQLANDLTGACI